MKILSEHTVYGYNIVINAPETHADFNYICNVSLAEHLYEKEEWTFYKLLNNERHYIRHIAALMHQDMVYGLAMIWDYAKRVTDKGLISSEEELLGYGFLQHSVGVYVPPKFRYGRVGSMVVNHVMASFAEPVFCNGNNVDQQGFWMSDAVDKTYLKFMLFDNNTCRHNF